MATLEDIEETLIESLREVVFFVPIIGTKKEIIQINEKEIRQKFLLFYFLIHEYLGEKKSYDPTFLKGNQEDQRRLEIIIRFLELDEYEYIAEALNQLLGHRCPN